MGSDFVLQNLMPKDVFICHSEGEISELMWQGTVSCFFFALKLTRKVKRLKYIESRAHLSLGS